MPLVVFDKLCEKIIHTKGEATFKSESYLQQEYSARTVDANAYTGGVIPGEIKLAMAIRILAGASYLDMILSYYVSPCSVYRVFHEVIGWIDESFRFPLYELLENRNWQGLHDIAVSFSSFTDGILYGIIGALDGVAIRIRCPFLSEVTDPGSYFCRKKFYALNVQVIVDAYKRVIWLSSGHKGSTHDSTAFRDTDLYELLMSMVDELEEKGLFLVGDKAFMLSPFMMTPYDDAIPGSAEDGFNFWQSNSRIRSECCFGEVIMRWGIFWRTLRFDISQVGKIINAACKLHNFLIDEREELDGETFHADVSTASEGSTAHRSETALPLLTDNNEDAPAGRRSRTDNDLLRRGEAVRNRIALNLSMGERSRPIHPSVRYNRYGHPYMVAL